MLKLSGGGFLTGTMPGTELAPESFLSMLFRAASRWFLARAGRKILPFRQNTTCSRVCVGVLDAPHNSFGMGEPRGMLDL